MLDRYRNVKTSIESLDANQNFKLYLTYYHGGKKPLLLGMHISYKNLYAAPSSQVSNLIRSYFRKFGNEFLKKIPPNEFFTIGERTINKEVHKSLVCNFIKSEKVFIDIVEAHAMTQAWDQLMMQYDLSKLFCSGQIFSTVKVGNKLNQRMAGSDKEQKPLNLPASINNFLEEIIETERI